MGKVISLDSRRKKQESSNDSINLDNVTMVDFVNAVGQDRNDFAALILAQVFYIPIAVASKATEHFARLYKSEQPVVKEAMTIRKSLMDNANNDALVTLYNCFGLQGPHAIVALENLRKLL